jgi:dTDP-4-dehydrorhamnose 3,5-epimerase
VQSPDGGNQLDGVVLRALEVHPDTRGEFIEVFADHWDGSIDPVQWSLVRSRSGTLRGMHLHRRHAELLMVVSGRISVGLHDARPDSPTQGEWARYDLSAHQPTCLTFPAGLVHGWLAHEDAVHLQAVSEAYDYYADDDNDGCHWADPALGIEWPFEPTILSERAAAFPPLYELLGRS